MQLRHNVHVELTGKRLSGLAADVNSCSPEGHKDLELDRQREQTQACPDWLLGSCVSPGCSCELHCAVDAKFA